MDFIKNFFSVLSGQSGSSGQRVFYYLCLIIVLILLFALLNFIHKLRKHKDSLAAIEENTENDSGNKVIVWKDRRRNALGLPWSFERYRLTKEKFLLVTGFFDIKEEEVKLYRVLDLSLNRSFGQRLTGTGTVVIKSNDKTLPIITLKNIKRPNQVKELISRLVEKERLAKRVGSSEMMGLRDHVDLDGDGIADAPACDCDMPHIG